jgi:hypothetical protein
MLTDFDGRDNLVKQGLTSMIHIVKEALSFSEAGLEEVGVNR